MQVYNIILDHHQKETTQHGSLGFPLAIYTTRISRNILKAIPWHWHEELQFCVVMEGDVVFQINDHTVQLTAGEGIFINVGQMHQAKNEKGSDSKYICIDFHPQLISGFRGSLVEEKYVLPYIERPSAAYSVLQPAVLWQHSAIEKLLELHTLDEDKPAGYELTMQILLLQVWESLVREVFALPDQAAPHIWDPRIKQMIEYLHIQYMTRVRLEDLAASVNLSKSACCREFKHHVKCTIFEYLLDYRLIIATRMLMTTDAPVTQIAYECGFGSTSYFIEKFIKKSGLTPLAYRKDKLQ